MNSRIIVASPSSAKKALREIGAKEFNWAYLGENVLEAISIEKFMAGNGKQLEIANVVQKTAKDLREAYIDYIGKLSLENNSLEWWAGCLSEKTPYTSKVFLNSCFAKTALEMINKKENLILFVEKDCVRKTISLNIDSQEVPFFGDSYSEKLLNSLNNIKIFVIYNLWFLFKNIYPILVNKIYGMPKKAKSAGSSINLIFSPVNPNSFDSQGNYRESFFGELQGHLEKYGKDTALLPFIWVPFRQYHKIIKDMKNSSKLFFVPHALISVLDVLKASIKNLANFPGTKKFPLFEHMDINPIINADINNTWLRTRTASNLLFYDFIKGLKRKNIDMDTFIYVYENLSREKVMCSAFREFYPAAYLIGYQHSTLQEMRLDFFFSKYESTIIPLPDRIITNGKYYYDLFVKNGYPKQKVVEGAAIRYQYFDGIKEKNELISKTNPTILVTPPIELFEASAMLWLVFNTFRENEKYDVLLKFHPFLSFDKISKHLKLELPSNFRISEDRVGDLIPKSDILIYTTSTTSLEALKAGIPVVHISSSHFLDFDPLEFNPDLRCLASSAEELLKCVEKQMDMKPETLNEKRKIWKESVSAILGKVNEDTYKLFTRPKK